MGNFLMSYAKTPRFVLLLLINLAQIILYSFTVSYLFKLNENTVKHKDLLIFSKIGILWPFINLGIHLLTNIIEYSSRRVKGGSSSIYCSMSINVRWYKIIHAVLILINLAMLSFIGILIYFLHENKKEDDVMWTLAFSGACLAGVLGLLHLFQNFINIKSLYNQQVTDIVC